VNQNNIDENRDSCGIFVIVNSLLITYISKINNDISLMNKKDIVEYYVKYIKFMIYKYYQFLYYNNELEQEKIKDIASKLATYKLGNDPLEYDKIKDINEFNENEKYITEANAIYDFKGFHWNIPIKQNVFLNIDWLNTNVMIVESSFTKQPIDTICCSSVLFNLENNKKIKNFYSFNNYILTFIVGQKGHWSCYTVNKNKDTKQYLYLDSLPRNNIDNTIENKIIKLTSYSSYDEYVINVLKCYTAAANDYLTFNSYSSYIDNMFSLLLRESSFKVKIPYYDQFVKEIITRIITQDIMYFYINNEKCTHILKNIDHAINEYCSDDIKSYYYDTLYNYIKGYGQSFIDKNCIDNLDETTQKSLKEKSNQQSTTQTGDTSGTSSSSGTSSPRGSDADDNYEDADRDIVFGGSLKKYSKILVNDEIKLKKELMNQTSDLSKDIYNYNHMTIENKKYPILTYNNYKDFEFSYDNKLNIIIKDFVNTIITDNIHNIEIFNRFINDHDFRLKKAKNIYIILKPFLESKKIKISKNNALKLYIKSIYDIYKKHVKKTKRKEKNKNKKTKKYR
jgi:hypothetical protein